MPAGKGSCSAICTNPIQRKTLDRLNLLIDDTFVRPTIWPYGPNTTLSPSDELKYAGPAAGSRYQA